MMTAGGPIARIATTLSFSDRLGSWKARWDIGRMNYIVPPGLYAIGSPNGESPVLVTANYKMSYDIVRHYLADRNVWLLVLETYGINVWCAAGKGTFGTDELVRRIRETKLDRLVNHRQLLLPVLGAPGVEAHKVTRQTGFSIQYATIRAADIPAFLDEGMKTKPAMRELTFSFRERLVLIPVELVGALKPTAITALILLILSAVLQRTAFGLSAVSAYLGAVVAGAALTPLLLPWLPGRSFAFKGMVTGLLWWIVFTIATANHGGDSLMTATAFLALPAVSSFYALNFTGCTTFTSRSGVRKEMRIALPIMGCALLVSAVLLLAIRFL